MSDSGELEVLVRREVERVLNAQRETPTEKALLSQAQAAALIDVSVSTIRNWLRDGKLKRYGSGRVVRVARAELLALRGTSAETDGRAPAVDADAWASQLLRRRG